MNDEQLHEFYERLVRDLQRRGVLCAITSGLACVHFEVAETTKDCDLLCHEAHFGQLLEVLSTVRVLDRDCRYRGHLTPPLDVAWHRGGWTSHFQWGEGPEAVTLDVFGRALRGSGRWENELRGLYVSPHVVSEMKRTNRDKDWPFITSLGELLLETGDPRGWLHIFEAGLLRRLVKGVRVPEEILQRRPLLRLALEGSDLLEGSLMAERQFWWNLDRLRIEIYRRALKPYNLAVIRAHIPAAALLAEQHARRIDCAARSLAPAPMTAYGLDRLLDEARAATAKLVHPEAMKWLPDLRPNFFYLEP